ncbi:MAG: HpcH/HpaI aldolase/citrate lyase family protein, partial [Blastocatellia bacterium]|nr:HpcH/HpaI aldolase/citrate lyase family protein [Blastocatellia bacterium]
ALGALLYMPAHNKNIEDILLRQKYPSLTSVVLCLEDAISDDELESTERFLINLLKNSVQENCHYMGYAPMIFIRVRNPDHFESIYKQLGDLSCLTGYVLPKFDSCNAEHYLHVLKEVNSHALRPVYCMPILESSKVMYRESRVDELTKLHRIIANNRELVLNIRIGVTDLCGLYSIRRSPETTIYDIGVVRDCISDIVNFFSRAASDYVISGPVWEYFEKDRSYQLGYTSGLIREIILDKANTLLGKTIIHPNHIPVVNSLYAVTQEEFRDAQDIIGSKQNGVLKSSYRNKMNEVKPHLNWAQRVMRRAHVYGVLNEGQTHVDLLEAIVVAENESKHRIDAEIQYSR